MTYIALSSNGRTEAFEAFNRGSNPWRATLIHSLQKNKVLYYVLVEKIKQIIIMKNYLMVQGRIGCALHIIVFFKKGDRIFVTLDKSCVGYERFYEPEEFYDFEEFMKRPDTSGFSDSLKSFVTDYLLSK